MPCREEKADKPEEFVIFYFQIENQKSEIINSK
jgi:hypothetical protein